MHPSRSTLHSSGGATVVYATDHEPHSVHERPTAAPGPVPLPLHPEDQRHVDEAPIGPITSSRSTSGSGRRQT